MNGNILEFFEEGFEFEGARYRYKNDGKPVHSVTEVIHEFIPFRHEGEAVERASVLGRAVHKTTELMDKDTLESYDPQIEPWLEGWRKFKRDLPGILAKCGRLIVDIKTGAKTKTWNIQMGGYSLFETETNKPIIEGRFYNEHGFAGTVDRVYWGKGRKSLYGIVQLTGNGMYKFEEVPTHISVYQNQFLSMLNVSKIKKEFGV